MRHLRSDYDAIQPWPTKRPHTAKSPEGEIVTGVPCFGGNPIDPVEPIIPDDEPVFLLRAKDRFAVGLVRAWAQMLDSTQPHPGVLSGHYDHEKDALVHRVLAWAEEMHAYAIEHYEGGKLLDTPKEFLR